MLKKLILTVFWVIGWGITSVAMAQVAYPIEVANTEPIVKCYPNPAITYTEFSFSEKIPSGKLLLVIYSITGRKMTEKSVVSKKMRIDLAAYYRGIYLYRLLNEAGTVIETGKFQVAK